MEIDRSKEVQKEFILANIKTGAIFMFAEDDKDRIYMRLQKNKKQRAAMNDYDIFIVDLESATTEYTPEEAIVIPIVGKFQVNNQ